MNNNRHFSPLQVRLASSLLLLYWVFGIIKVLVGHHPPTSYLTAAVFMSFFGSILLCIWLISRWSNWARWLFLVWIVRICYFTQLRLQHHSSHFSMCAV